eukprot:4441506-Pyramimonas_sp.AAC.1
MLVTVSRTCDLSDSSHARGSVFSLAAPQWRAELREETAELLRGRRGVAPLELRCAAPPAIEGAEHARAAIA